MLADDLKTKLAAVFKTFLILGSLAPLIQQTALSEELGTPVAEQPLELEFDSVVASVDSTPILISEIRRRLKPPRELTSQNFSQDAQAKAILDAIIFEKLIELEASKRQLSASSDEVEQYIASVASKNNLTIEGLQQAIAAEGGSYAEYKERLKLEILKGKLASIVIRDGISISEDEVDEYLENNPQSSSADSNETQYTLKQITIELKGKDQEGVKAKLTEIAGALSQGQTFEEVAAKYSESPDAEKGGLLGEFKESDLSADILGVIKDLEVGQIARPVQIGPSIKIFKLDSKREPKTEESTPEDERQLAREKIRDSKRDSVLNTFFEKELYTLHDVDKKL